VLRRLLVDHHREHDQLLFAADDTVTDVIPGSGGTGNSVGPAEGNTNFVLDSVNAVQITFGGASQLIDVNGICSRQQP